MNSIWKLRLSIVLFVFGVLLGMVCAGLAAWGDMEATLFDASITPDAPLTTLRCPVLVTTVETATVSATFGNPTARPVNLLVRAHFSRGYVTLIREEQTRLPLEPGESKQLSWTVQPADAAFGRVILVRVHALRSGSLPYRAGACGIVVVPISFLSGDLFWALLAAAGLLGLGGGIALWIVGHRPLFGRPLGVVRAMGTLAGILVAAAVLALLGAWLLTLILLLLTLLLSGVMIGYVLTSR